MLAVREALLQPRGPSPLCREANGIGIHAQSWKSSFLAGDNCRRNGPGDSVAAGVLDSRGERGRSHAEVAEAAEKNAAPPGPTMVIAGKWWARVALRSSAFSAISA